MSLMWTFHSKEAIMAITELTLDDVQKISGACGCGNCATWVSAVPTPTPVISGWNISFFGMYDEAWSQCTNQMWNCGNNCNDSGTIEINWNWQDQNTGCNTSTNTGSSSGSNTSSNTGQTTACNTGCYTGCWSWYRNIPRRWDLLIFFGRGGRGDKSGGLSIETGNLVAREKPRFCNYLIPRCFAISSLLVKLPGRDAP